MVIGGLVVAAKVVVLIGGRVVGSTGVVLIGGRVVGLTVVVLIGGRVFSFVCSTVAVFVGVNVVDSCVVVLGFVVWMFGLLCVCLVLFYVWFCNFPLFSLPPSPSSLPLFPSSLFLVLLKLHWRS